jgi:outer membrane lipoprotein-sorting protein
MNKLRLATPIALIAVLAGVISGCTAGAGQQLSAGDILQKMHDTMKSATSAQGTFDLNLTINKDGLKTLTQGLMGSMGGMMNGKGSTSTTPGGNGASKVPSSTATGSDWTANLPDSVSATINYWQKSPNKVRADVVTASYPEANGSSVIYDGQKVYALDAANKTVYTGTPGKNADKMPPQLKSMLANVDVQKIAASVISATNVTLVGNEQVAGVDAYKLDITVKPDVATILGIPQAYAMPAGVILKDFHATLDVDSARFVPLKFTLEHPQMGSFTYTASKLDLNKTIDDSTFVLQVPAGYKTVDLDQAQAQVTPKQINLSQAEAAAKQDGWSLLEPTYLPTGATLVGVTQMQKAMNGGFVLSYSSPSADFTIMEAKSSMMNMLSKDFTGMNGPSGKAMGAGTTVTVRGVQARAFSVPSSGWTALIWQEKDSGIWVAIQGKFSQDEAVKIAEGLK